MAVPAPEGERAGVSDPLMLSCTLQWGGPARARDRQSTV
jgi:hypothetical protein